MKFKNIKEWFKNRYIKEKTNAIAKKKSRIYMHSCQSFQIMEFNGLLYISHDGVPVVRVDDLKHSAAETLKRSRSDYFAWKNQFSNE